MSYFLEALCVISLAALCDRVRGGLGFGLDGLAKKVVREALVTLYAPTLIWACGVTDWRLLLTAAIAGRLVSSYGLLQWGAGTPQGYAIDKMRGVDVEHGPESWQPRAWVKKPYRSMTLYGAMIWLPTAVCVATVSGFVGGNVSYVAFLLPVAGAIASPVALWADVVLDIDYDRLKIRNHGWALNELLRGAFTAAICVAVAG